MVHVDPTALRASAERFESEVGAKLAQARQTLEKAQSLNYADFTTVHVALASAVVEAWNFQHRDLATKLRTATDFRTGLEATAEHWEQADAASTVTDQGAGSW